MNRYAYRTTGLAIRTLASLVKASIRLHGTDHIPEGAVIFVANHFTRFETLILPYHIHQATHRPVWSLASHELFTPRLKGFFDKVGVVSTKDPDRDRLIVRSLLLGEATWIIFPEGRMVKDKKTVRRGRFMVSAPDGFHRPHTGAATLALRSEFYRQRFRCLEGECPQEVTQLLKDFGIEDVGAVDPRPTHIVPVNLTYYPIRAQENLLTQLAKRFSAELPDRMVEEMMTEGTMLLEGVDVDIRFGRPLAMDEIVCDSQRIVSDVKRAQHIGFDDWIPSRKRMRQAAVDIMQRYMRRIYAMTTLNPDHLMAAILRWCRGRTLSETDFAQRVFLAAVECQKIAGLYLHQCLHYRQMRLMTDDGFGRLEGFLTVAEEKRVVERASEWIRIMKRPSPIPAGFHRSRIDALIDVMANEIEPMPRVVKRLKRIAGMSGWRLRRRLRRYLLNGELEDFEADYRRNYSEETAKPRAIGRPIFIRGRRREIGVVLVHGYMAAPAEVAGAAEYLGRRGFCVYAPRLKGHGTSPEDLAQSSYHDWLDTVHLAYAAVKTCCRKVVLGGFSTGAGLVLHMVAGGVPAAGVVAVCPPMRLQDLSSRLVPAVDVWNRFMKMVHIDRAQMAFVDNHPENPHINYHRNPIAGVRELDRLMDDLAPRLDAVTVPALIVQSHGDPVVNPAGSKKLFDRLGSADKTYLLVNQPRHGILLGDGADRIYRAIDDFIHRLQD